MSFPCLGKEVVCLCSASWLKLVRLCRSFCFLLSCIFRFLLLRVNPFCIQVFYFVFLSFLGYWVLRDLRPRTNSFRPRDLDLLFTSVSAATVSSMSTVEMEVFSNSQLVVMIFLMLVGGEIFTSLIGLHFRKSKLRWFIKTEEKVTSVKSNLFPSNPTNDIADHIELSVTTNLDCPISQVDPQLYRSRDESIDLDYLKYCSVRFLCFVVLGYLLVIHVLGVAAVSLYMALVSSAGDLLKKKGLKMVTFSIFTVVSTFASCGFVPTNENMMVFSKNSGLLLILIPQVLLGNTLFPSTLRFTLWLMGRFGAKAEEIKYLLSRTSEVGYNHLLPSLYSSLLVLTVLGFIVVQFLMFCSMQWDSEVLNGLSTYEKIVGVLFQCVNSRHTGETIADLSQVAPAILVVFVVMMYLPPYTLFLPAKGGERLPGNSKRRWPKKSYKQLLENLIFSQLSYLAIFVVMVCITESKKMKEDPLNFNVLNIVVEVISAYGNVGFSMGYSCERQLRPVEGCVDKWYGFSGKWSDRGKIILIIVMIFGRLKKFNMMGGRAWILL